MADIELDKRVARKYVALMDSAEKRGKEFDLSLTSLRNIYRAKRCYYTGVPFTETGPNSISIDRVDNSKGYVTGNVVACTRRINSSKGNMSRAELGGILRGMERKEFT